MTVLKYNDVIKKARNRDYYFEMSISEISYVCRTTIMAG